MGESSGAPAFAGQGAGSRHARPTQACKNKLNACKGGATGARAARILFLAVQECLSPEYLLQPQTQSLWERKRGWGAIALLLCYLCVAGWHHMAVQLSRPPGCACASLGSSNQGAWSHQHGSCGVAQAEGRVVGAAGPCTTPRRRCSKAGAAVGPGVGDKVIDGDLDRLPFRDLFECFHDQLVVKGI